MIIEDSGDNSGAIALAPTAVSKGTGCDALKLKGSNKRDNHMFRLLTAFALVANFQMGVYAHAAKNYSIGVMNEKSLDYKSCKTTAPERETRSGLDDKIGTAGWHELTYVFVSNAPEQSQKSQTLAERWVGEGFKTLFYAAAKVPITDIIKKVGSSFASEAASITISKIAGLFIGFINNAQFVGNPGSSFTFLISDGGTCIAPNGDALVGKQYAVCLYVDSGDELYYPKEVVVKRVYLLKKSRVDLKLPVVQDMNEGNNLARLSPSLVVLKRTISFHEPGTYLVGGTRVQVKIENTKTPASTTPTPTDGLVAYYPFNSNAKDERGNQNNGTVQGARLTLDRFNRTNHAYKFDGNSDVIDCGNSSLFHSRDVTVSCWIKYYGTLPIRDAALTIVTKAIKGGDGWVIFATGDNVGAEPSMQSSWKGFLAKDKIIPNKWNHVVFTYQSRSNVASIYWNSSLQNSINFQMNPAKTANLQIGNGYNTLGSYGTRGFVGSIDDIRLYNRALTEDEVKSLYHENGWK